MRTFEFDKEKNNIFLLMDGVPYHLLHTLYVWWLCLTHKSMFLTSPFVLYKNIFRSSIAYIDDTSLFHHEHWEPLPKEPNCKSFRLNSLTKEPNSKSFRLNSLTKEPNCKSFFLNAIRISCVGAFWNEEALSSVKDPIIMT